MRYYLIRIIRVIYSVFFVFQILLKNKEYDFVFITSNLYNRGGGGKSEYFAPFLLFCNKNKYRYLYFEQLDLKGLHKDKPINWRAIPMDLVDIIRVIVRKYVTISRRDTSCVDQISATIITATILRSIRFKIFIEVPGGYASLFRKISPSSIICEYQNGRIDDEFNSPYTKNGRAQDYYVLNDIKLLTYSKLFSNRLAQYDTTGFYEKNAVNVGFYREEKYFAGSQTNSINKTILYTLSIAEGASIKEFEWSMDLLQGVLDNNKFLFEKHNYKLLIKHHPRYTPSKFPACHMKELYVSYASIGSPLLNVLKQSRIHITVNSGVFFEASLCGIPTILIDDERFVDKDYKAIYQHFIFDFDYPLDELIVRDINQIGQLILSMENNDIYHDYANKVYNWSRQWFEKFDNNKLEILYSNN